MTMMANASCSSSADVPKAKRLEADAGRCWPPTVVAEVVDSISSSRSNSRSSSQACAQVFFRWAIVPNLFLGVWELQSKESHSSNHFLWFQSVAKVFAWMIGSIYQYNFPPKNAFITHSCQSVFDTAQESRACFHHWECG